MVDMRWWGSSLWALYKEIILSDHEIRRGRERGKGEPGPGTEAGRSHELSGCSARDTPHPPLMVSPPGSNGVSVAGPLGRVTPRRRRVRGTTRQPQGTHRKTAGPQRNGPARSPPGRAPPTRGRTQHRTREGMRPLSNSHGATGMGRIPQAVSPPVPCGAPVGSSPAWHKGKPPAQKRLTTSLSGFLWVSGQ